EQAVERVHVGEDGLKRALEAEIDPPRLPDGLGGAPAAAHPHRLAGEHLGRGDGAAEEVNPTTPMR
ncbi:MAG: hypothetical protein ACK559_30810, partial [bacterium]